jgi:DNA integrity scanning protein DisA with diadenylate cyclase activity
MSTLFHTSLWQVENEFVPQLNRVLTNVRSVNKTDVVTLLDVFGNLSGIVSASCEALRILFTESEILLDILTSLF